MEEKQKRTYTRRLNNSAERASIRLEIVRLCYRHDHESAKIVAKAREIEAYLFDDQPADKV